MWEQHVLVMMLMIVSIIVTRTIIVTIIIIIVVGIACVIFFVGRRDWRVQETYSMRSGAALMMVFFHTQMSKNLRKERERI